MIRFIIKTRRVNEHVHLDDTQYETVDMHLPELEKKLESGGYGEHGCDHRELVGIELREDEKEETDGSA